MCVCDLFLFSTGGSFLAGEEWTGGDDFGNPELHCCACGKKAACEDTPRWKNEYGATCETYEKEGHCKAGRFVEGRGYTGTDDFGSPWKHCCVCGKGGAAPPPSPPSPAPPAPPPPPRLCSDVPGWANPFGMDCGGMGTEGHCVCTGGFRPENCGLAKGHEWAGGAKFSHPEKNCCLCGKGVG